LRTRYFFLLGFAALAFLAWASGALAWMAEPENVRGFLAETGPLGPVVYVLSFALLHPLGVPGLFFVIPASLVWPVGLATALSVVGASLAGAVAFGVAHRMGVAWIEQHMPERLQRATERARERPFRTVFLVRLFFFLFSPAHWALAISGVPFGPFLIGSILGFTPLMLLYVAGGRTAALWMVGQRPWVWAGIGILLGFVWLGGSALRRRRAGPGGEPGDPS
jgi:uncharacterized membrane protein YdjX (TVP38/TMEM64 family)